MNNIYCIVGPSGCGKTTLVEALQKEYGYKVANEHEHGVTADLIEQNDLCVIDPAGIEFLKEKYNGSKGIKVIGLEASPDILIERMQNRGDSEEKIVKRLVNDAEMFRGFQNVTDIILNTGINTIDELCDAVKYHIDNYEEMSKHKFSLLNERGEVEAEGRRFYTYEDAEKSVLTSYPEGLPDGWSLRDDTEVKRKEYEKLIKKAKPSFKSSMIKIDMENAGVFDGLLVVPFKYKNTEYFYRDYLYKDETWIDKREKYITEFLSASASLKYDIHLLKKKMDKLKISNEPTFSCEKGIRFLENAFEAATQKESARAFIGELVDNLSVTLEVEKQMDDSDNEIFYRYSVGNFKLWFTQNTEHGNIYSVGLAEQGDELKDFELSVYANECGRGSYYPNVFEIRGRSNPMSTGCAREYIHNMEQACAVLDAIEVFFKNSKHYELFSKYNKSVDDVLKDATQRSKEQAVGNETSEVAFEKE